MIGGCSLKELVKEEIIERRQEGCIVPDYAFDDLSEEELEKVYNELENLKISDSFNYTEPNGLENILAASKGCNYKKEPDRKTLFSSFYGAWLGRIVGCIMGKPVERYPYGGGTDKLKGWECIKLWQDGAGDNFPPTDYISGLSKAEKNCGLMVGCAPSLRENLKYAESDDDIRYLVLGLIVNEKYGNDFTAMDIADIWQSYLVPSMTYTAERIAYVNSLTCPDGSPEEKAIYCNSHRNPFREWIGAQIRIDHYGYYNAGDPLNAAKAAFNDANLSHTKNGVYGAMFFAALISLAFTEKNIRKCIDIALSVIPQKSRLYDDIQFAIETAENSANAIELYKKMWERFGELSAVHTNNNAAVCVASLIMGDGDFARSVGIAVGAGWDTDCNGATVGSFMGALLGNEKIPEYLSAPLNDTLYSSVIDFHPVSIKKCAERTYKAFEKKSEMKTGKCNE
ncbi:MAG: ADP-ribosylglycohydrolase family protein [Ruminococcus sp.]|nr:ADP-ribosylglycohydrolase family protein [Candidatus Copronaster equi]